MKTFFAVIIICAVVCGAFYRYLNVFFCLDDFDFLGDIFYGRLSSFNGLTKVICRPIWGMLRPMDSIYWFFTGHAFGFHPLPYNLVRLGIFAGIAVLIFLITSRIVGNKTTALYSALIYGLHPIHADTFSLIGLTPGLTGVFFFSLSFWLFILYLEGKASIIFSLISYCIALASWEAAIVLPALLSAYLVCIRNIRPVKLMLRRISAFAVIAVLYLSVFVLTSFQDGSTVNNFYEPFSTGVVAGTSGYFIQHAFSPLFNGGNALKGWGTVIPLCLLSAGGLVWKEGRGAVCFSLAAFLIGYVPFLTFGAWIRNPHDLWISLMFFPVCFILPAQKILDAVFSRGRFLRKVSRGAVFLLIGWVLLSSSRMLGIQRGEKKPFFHIAEQRKTLQYLEKITRKLKELPDDSSVYLAGLSDLERDSFRLHVGIRLIYGNPAIKTYYIDKNEIAQYEGRANAYILDLSEKM